MQTRSRGRKSDETVDNDWVDIPSETGSQLFPNMVIKDEYKDKTGTKGLQGDRLNIALLMFLYVLQGIPLGLSGSIPYLLQSRSVNYKDQALFSFVFWPFSIKLLWAPIVDSVFLRTFGRRKSWMIPTQYLIGFFMLALSQRVTGLLGDASKPGDLGVSIMTLTVVFFMLNFLAATQDIAVDGWALTMLSRRNVGWASTCNSVGQTAGYFLGNVVFMALESPDFCNTYLRSEPQPHGLVTLADFMYFWGIVFMVTTTIVMLVKKERNDTEDVEGVFDTYKLLWKIMKLPAVMSFIGILLTAKIGFAAADAVTGLKLIEEGVPKDKLALLAVPMVPIQIILPFIISKYTAGPRPMDIFLRAMPFRLLMGFVFAGVVYWAPSTKSEEGVYPVYFYGVVLLVYAVHQISLYSMFVAQMSMHAKVSDPAIGGTYMTLLNTIANLGGNWPSTVVLWCIDSFTFKECVGGEGECYPKAEPCESAGGKCNTTLDGYYILMAICIVIGFIWYKLKAKSVRKLQDLGPSAWTCN